MRHLNKLVLCAALMLSVSGCAAFQKTVVPVLSEAAAYIADAQEVVNIVRAAADLFFLAHQDEKAHVKVTHLFGDVAQAIDAAILATKGATELSTEQLDDAWKDFRRAWAELQAVLQDTGVLGKDGRLGALRGSPGIPEPLAMRHR